MRVPAPAPPIHFALQMRFVSGPGNQPRRRNATRRQRELHIQTKTESGAYRRGIRKTRRLEERGKEACLGDGEQVGQGGQKERLRSRQEEQQSPGSKRWK